EVLGRRPEDSSWPRARCSRRRAEKEPRSTSSNDAPGDPVLRTLASLAPLAVLFSYLGRASRRLDDVGEPRDVDGSTSVPSARIVTFLDRNIPRVACSARGRDLRSPGRAQPLPHRRAAPLGAPIRRRDRRSSGPGAAPGLQAPQGAQGGWARRRGGAGAAAPLRAVRPAPPRDEPLARSVPAALGRALRRDGRAHRGAEGEGGVRWSQEEEVTWSPRTARPWSAGAIASS